MARGVLLRRARDPAAERARRIRRGNYAMLALVLGAAAAGWHWLADPQRFPLRTVEITGSLQHVDRAQLARSVAPATTGSFFSVDVAQVRSAARAVAWVDDAAVRRVWPDRLVIAITEQQAVARWAGGGLVNARGELFAAGPPYPPGLPLLAGPAAQAAEVYAGFREFARLLEPVGALEAATRDPRGTWRLTLADGTALTLPRRAPAKPLARFARLYATRLAGRVPPMAAVDLRYTDGFAVRHRPPQPPPPAPSTAKL